MLENIAELYDRVWVYGPQSFWNPLEGLDVPKAVSERLTYTGFLERDVPAQPANDAAAPYLPEKYILVTAGGGGDGSVLMEQVLAAREHDRKADFPIVMVLGPFMKNDSRARIRNRAAGLSNLIVLDFETRMEVLLKNAVAVVGMCGYNTFCEVLSFDRKALFVPRTTPRQEQYIRASRARELGLCDMLTPEEASVPRTLADALHRLPLLDKPSIHLEPNALNGLDAICDEVEALVSDKTDEKTFSSGKDSNQTIGSLV